MANLIKVAENPKTSSALNRVERLERRVLLSGSSPIAELVLNGVPIQETASLKVEVDSSGQLLFEPSNPLLHFSLTAPENALALQLSISGNSNLRVIIARDANGDGLLDATELASPIVDQIISGQQAAFNQTLPQGGYFMEMEVANVYSPGQFDVNCMVAGTTTAVATPSARVTGPNGGAISLNGAATTSNGTDFGTFKVGATAPRETFTIVNTGGASLDLGPVFVPAGFQLISGLPPVLSPGASAGVVVQLNTVTAGVSAGSIHFTTNVAGESPFAFEVRGTIIAAPPPQVGSISGVVFDDYNHNGRSDPGDIPLAGRKVYVDVHNLGHFVSTDPSALTDGTGTYHLNNLSPGADTIREVFPAGWRPTAPAGSAYRVTVLASRNSGPFNFAEAPPASTAFLPFNVYYGAVLQAENFDNGGEGIAYHDKEPKNLGGAYGNTGVDIERLPGSGFFVGYIQPSEWLNYTVNVQTAGLYSVGFHFRPLGSNLAGNAKFHLEVDGVNVTGAISVPTGPFTFTTLNKAGVRLTAGKHVLRVFFDSSAPKQGYLGNFDWISFNR